MDNSSFHQTQTLQIPDNIEQHDSVTTTPHKMTRARALLLCLMEQYSIPGYSLTPLEIQKLAYLLQIAGEPLKLQYIKDQHGPDAEKLHPALQRLEDHYIQGYSTRDDQAEIQLLPGAAETARVFLASASDARDILSQVSCLIEGFESPMGSLTPNPSESAGLSATKVKNQDGLPRSLVKLQPSH